MTKPTNPEKDAILGYLKRGLEAARKQVGPNGYAAAYGYLEGTVEWVLEHPSALPPPA